MKQAELDMTHRLISELGIYAKSAQQYGNAGMAAVMINAAAMLQVCLGEAEAAELALGRLVNDSMYKDHPEASQMAIDVLKAREKTDG